MIFAGSIRRPPWYNRAFHSPLHRWRILAVSPVPLRSSTSVRREARKWAPCRYQITPLFRYSHPYLTTHCITFYMLMMFIYYSAGLGRFRSRTLRKLAEYFRFLCAKRNENNSWKKLTWKSFNVACSRNKCSHVFCCSTREKFSTIHFNQKVKMPNDNMRDLFKKIHGLFDCAARVGFRRIRLVSLGSYRSTN